MAASSTSWRVLDAEANYLRDVAIAMKVTDKSRRACAVLEMAMVADRHRCDAACSFINLRPGQTFESRGTQWQATGSVYVCKRTAKPHTCDDYCNDSEIMSRGEGLVCRVRGVQLCQEYSLARSRLDPDIRVVGTLSYVPHAFYDAGDDEPRQQEDYGEEGKADEQDDKDSNEDAQSWSCGETVFEMLLKRANNVEADVVRVLERFPRMSALDLCAQIDQRVEWRRYAESVWQMHALSEKYREMQHRKAEADTEVWIKESCDYIAKCDSSGMVPDMMHVLRLWMIYVHNSYQGVYVGGDIEETNQRNKVYFIECMLRIWEQYTELPIVSEHRVTFPQCCMALLKSLQEGLSIEIWLVGDNPKPRRGSSLTDAEKLRASMIRVEMIRAHPELKLVPLEVVRAANIKDKNNAAARRMPRVSTVSGKVAFPNRQRGDVTKKRSRDVFLRSIPQQKNLCNIMDDVITQSKTVEELRRYAF